MPLGREVDLGPGDTVLDGDPAPLPKNWNSSPHFTAHVYCGPHAEKVWRIKKPRGMKVGLGQGQGHIRWGPSSSTKKWWGHDPPIFGPCLLWPNARPYHLLLSTCINVAQKVSTRTVAGLLFQAAGAEAAYECLWQNWQLLSSWDGWLFGHNRHEPEIGGSWVPI